MAIKLSFSLYIKLIFWQRLLQDFNFTIMKYKQDVIERKSKKYSIEKWENNFHTCEHFLTGSIIILKIEMRIKWKVVELFLKFQKILVKQVNVGSFAIRKLLYFDNKWFKIRIEMNIYIFAHVIPRVSQ